MIIDSNDDKIFQWTQKLKLCSKTADCFHNINQLNEKKKKIEQIWTEFLYLQITTLNLAQNAPHIWLNKKFIWCQFRKEN